MDEIENKILYILSIGLAVAIILSLILLIFKIDFKKTNFLAFIFAFLFFTAYLFQPIFVALDYLIFLYETSKKRERNYKRIDRVFTLIYKITGYIGTGFSLVILPIFKNYYFSGYITFCGKLGDSLKRYFRDDLMKYYIIAIPVVIILIVGIIFYFLEKEIVLNAKDLVLNCTIIPGIFNCLLYIGCFLPILFSELSFSYDCCGKKREKYKEILTGVIERYLYKDKKRLAIAFQNIIKAKREEIFNADFDDEIDNTIEECKNCKDEKGHCFLAIRNYEDEIDDKTSDKNSVAIISTKTFYKIVCDSLTDIYKILLTIPRKIFVKENIDKKFEKTPGKFYLIYSFIMILIALFVVNIEIFGDYFKYSESKDSYKRVTVYKVLFLFLLLVLYYISVLFTVLKRNSITNQMLYGKRNSDTLCVLNFATEISGLITPVSFIVIYSKFFGIYEYDDIIKIGENQTFYPHNNMVFTKLYKYIIIENINPLFKLNITFQESFHIYSVFKNIIILFFFFGTFCFHSLTLKLGCCCPKKMCGKKRCGDIRFKYIFNDKNERCCPGKNLKRFQDIEEGDMSDFTFEELLDENSSVK